MCVVVIKYRPVANQETQQCIPPSFKLYIICEGLLKLTNDCLLIKEILIGYNDEEMAVGNFRFDACAFIYLFWLQYVQNWIFVLNLAEFRVFSKGFQYIYEQIFYIQVD